jgi:hypothetical protein
MKKARMFFILAITALELPFAGCDQTQSTDAEDEKTANEKSTQAYTEMENLFASSGDITDKNFSNVEKLYADAVAADPTNATANFGAAFSHILNTMSDTAIRNTINRWDNVPLNSRSSMLKFGIPTGTNEMVLPTQTLGKNLVKIIQTATSDPPTITEMQNLMRDRVLPRINYALARLAVVEKNPAFELRISGKMQGNVNKKDVYLDLTEVYVMDAMLYGMKSVVEQFLVFRFDLPNYTTKAAVAALQQNSTSFFVLASDGAVRAQSVKASLLGAVGKLRSGVTFLKNETDDQDNDIIKRGNDGLSVSDIDTMLVYLNKIESALTGTFTIEVKDADSDNNDYTISVSLNTFYNNLPQNPKAAWFPAYTVDSTANGDLQFRFQAQDYASFTFPDPTFSGLFPGMSNETLKRLLYIDEEFAWQVSVSMNDQNGTLGSSTSMKMVVNGITYTPKQGYNSYSDSWWRSFDFYIQSGDGLPVQLIAVVNGVDVPLQLYGTVPRVRLKKSDYINADVTTAPKNITAQYMQPNITVTLQQSAVYRMERSVNNGAFTVVDSSSYRYSYTDGAVGAKTTYSYRAMRIASYYPYGFYAYRPNNYTNTVSVTTP